ncbi:MAG: ABC transporter permease [Thermoproteota archaeon]
MVRRAFRCIVSEVLLEYVYMLRYKEWILAALLYPIIFASLPIFLGTWIASGAEEAAKIFAENVGTEAYSVFLLIGANMWFFMMTALWDFGLKLRKEQASGVIEDVYLSAGNLTWPLIGSGLFSASQCLARYVLSMFIGSILFGTMQYILSSGFLLSFAILGVGLVGVYGLSFLIGAIFLRVKEAFSLLVIFQMLFGILMGIFYPVSFLPYGLNWISYLLPMTIALNDMRAALLSTEYVFNLYLDLVIMILQSSIYMFVGFVILRRSEKKIRREAGLASF